MHAELAAVPDSLYNVTRANRVIAVVSIGDASAGPRIPDEFARCSLNFLLDLFFRVMGELVAGLLLRLPGIFFTKWFKLESDSNPDGCFVLLVGLLFWLVVGGCIWLAVYLL